MTKSFIINSAKYMPVYVFLISIKDICIGFILNIHKGLTAPWDIHIALWITLWAEVLLCTVHTVHCSPLIGGLLDKTVLAGREGGRGGVLYSGLHCRQQHSLLQGYRPLLSNEGAWWWTNESEGLVVSCGYVTGWLYLCSLSASSLFISTGAKDTHPV